MMLGAHPAPQVWGRCSTSRVIGLKGKEVILPVYFYILKLFLKKFKKKIN